MSTAKLEPLAHYRWDWKAWRSDRRVQRMSWPARGLFRELLDEAWIEGSIPENMQALADICGCSLEDMERFWVEIEPCWTKVEGGFRSDLIDTLLAAKDSERRAKAEAGRLGGLAGNRRAIAKQQSSSSITLPPGFTLDLPDPMEEAA